MKVMPDEANVEKTILKVKALSDQLLAEGITEDEPTLRECYTIAYNRINGGVGTPGPEVRRAGEALFDCIKSVRDPQFTASKWAE